MAMKRRARSSETVRPLPVRMTNADALSGTIRDRPSTRTRGGSLGDRAGEEVRFDGGVVEVVEEEDWVAAHNSAEIRFSSSSRWRHWSPRAYGPRPKAIIAMQRARSPLPAPAPDIGAALRRMPGANMRLGRHIAVSNAATKRRFILARRQVDVDYRNSVDLESFGIGEAESAEGLAEEPQGRLRLRPRGSVRNETAEIRHVLAPHA